MALSTANAPEGVVRGVYASILLVNCTVLMPMVMGMYASMDAWTVCLCWQPMWCRCLCLGVWRCVCTVGVCCGDVYMPMDAYGWHPDTQHVLLVRSHLEVRSEEVRLNRYKTTIQVAARE